jgi:hypothetical protein
MNSDEASKNQRVLDALKSAGDAFDRVREIEHWAYFPNEGKRMVFVAKSQTLGLHLRDLSENNKSANRYGARLVQADIPTSQTMNDVTTKLVELAEECGGEYDGWECAVVR